MTGDLYIGDVGQNAREEIDVQPASSTGGENYGWRVREGTISFNPNPPLQTVAINPIYDYITGTNGDFQGRSVTGGYVYRGPISEIQGHYFFADYVTNRVWSFKWDGSNPSTFNGSNFTQFINWTSLITTNVGTISSVSSFAEDEIGNLYIIDLGGEIFRIDAATLAIRGDLNADGEFNNQDISPFVLALTNPKGFAAEYPGVNLLTAGDFNDDGSFNNLDITGFVEALTEAN